MPTLSSVPFLRLTLSLALGIGVAFFCINQPIETYVQCTGLTLLPVILLLAFLLYRFKPHTIWPGLSIQAVFVLLGLCLGYYSQSVFYQSFFFTNAPKEGSSLILKLQEPLSEKQNTWRATAAVMGQKMPNGQTLTAKGQLLVYWPKRTNPVKPSLDYGDVIVVPNLAISMPSAAFPQGFDFKAVMRYRDVQHQLFFGKGHWVYAGNKGSVLRIWAYKLQRAINSKLNALFVPRVSALLQSLLIGYKDAVDAEDIKAFSVSGTMHVLAVSGMHVGLLYVVILFLLTGKKKLAQFPVWRGILIIAVLWLFALVTGLTASVMRAVIMFTILEAGRSFFRQQGNMINSLFASAFLQLLFNPLQLIDVGFQLSYLAVLGILVLYPKLAMLWMPPGKLLQLIYQSALVSIAATLATFPVTLYFFGSFPLWFIPANLIIVPLSTLVILLAAVTLLLSWIPILASFLVWLTHFAATVLITIVHFISNLPGASLTGLQPDELGVLLLLLCLVSASLYFVYQLRYSLLFSALSAFLLGGWIVLSSYIQKHSSEAIVCELRGNMLLALRHGNKVKVYSAPVSRGKADTLCQFMQPYLQKYKVTDFSWHIVNGRKETFGPFIFTSIYPLSSLQFQQNPSKYFLRMNRYSQIGEIDNGATLITQKGYEFKSVGKFERILIDNDYVRVFAK